ncbi:unnamed protein product [Brassica rapa]|uniref:UBA domain-containing protein n=1 Tax=Brassica campestris TaxID=3711 RepID=A0A3P6CDX3_BRACM|nr:unnamed protein product [Brassica rapa]VDD16887.1 unnamed protein product [Brassica rapa]
MGGVSFNFGELLKSVEEAQEHAEITSHHSNFAESTEAVLNLVCTTCCKPCRSRTYFDYFLVIIIYTVKESELHTKRTGHTEFVDKIMETVKSTSLEAAPKPAMEIDNPDDCSSGSGDSAEEMVVPEVDKNILEELEAMGFPKARATRALHYSGNASLEAAVNWMVEHENDPDVDELPKVKSVDWISKLSNDVLLMILSRLSTKEAIRTSVLSTRWEHVWKHVSHLDFDKPEINSSTEFCEEPNPDDTLITKVIIKHLGQLESCVLNYSSSQGRTGILNIWIQIFTSVKHTRVLTLNRHYDGCGKVFEFPSDSFSHPSLMSLSLSSYMFTSSDPFRNCSNLRTLKLVLIEATNVEVFNTLLSSCPSLEVLVLNIRCFYETRGPLKIENSKLKLVHVLLKRNIGGLEVSSTSLDILVVEDTSFGKKDFFLSSPKVQFTNNFWVAGRFAPQISYYISKEEKSIVHEEFMNNISGGLCESIGDVLKSMSVSIDLMNRTEVERLRQVLRLWICEMLVLEIIFKDNKNAPNESWEKKLWEEDNNNNVVFPNAKFRVKALWMPNFSGSEEEFAFVSCLIKHGTVVDKMMIKTSAFAASKKLEIEAAVDKLRALQTEEDQLLIKCF